jgi:hypothetical protein
VRESRTPGSVRGVLSNEHPYRDSVPLISPATNAWKSDICLPQSSPPRKTELRYHSQTSSQLGQLLREVREDRTV